MRYLMILAMALLLSSSCALCQSTDRSQDDPVSTILRELVVASSDDLKSYTFSMEMEQDMMLENLSSGQSQQVQTRSIGFGLVNVTDQALKLVMASLTYIPGDEGNSTALALEEYLQNDTIYMKIDGNWTAMELSGLGDVWSQQNSLDQQIDMLNQSRLTLVGSEMVGDEDCYKVRAEIDIASYADPLSQEVASIVPFIPLNFSDLFRNMTMEVHYWISKESQLLKRADMFETLYMTPQSLGLQSSEEENMAVRMSSTTSVVFDGFNESVNILLPPEASAAQLFNMSSYPESEAVAVSLLDQDGLNETAVIEALPATVADDALPQDEASVVLLENQSLSA
ncbi:MAG: DUF6612 family protein [Methanothrix soehngenii]|jgi:hypothetical protein|uniref:DUF6612 family protein n=3 Tax=Methanothrix soehngenii TaxID=2223 RepID=UPI002A43EC30|nr:hypothetical protein [Methanothrix soehngenii]MDD3552679.1 hypothetical protein [Methanothrix soehngenii]